MSTPNPTHIIAEAVHAGVGGLAGRHYFDELAEHVVSKLTDAGYSIVKVPESTEQCQDRYPLSDSALLCQRDSGHMGGHEALDASRDRFRWPNLATNKGSTDE